NVIAPIIVYTTLLIPTNILAEASLSFLGLGVPPDIPSWGAQISEATSIYRIAPWTMIFPGIFLLLTTLAFNLVGDGLRDAFDPKTARLRITARDRPRETTLTQTKEGGKGGAGAKTTIELRVTFRPTRNGEAWRSARE